MDSDDLRNLLNIKGIEEKIFKYKTMYHPNLVTNLSKEMYDLYLTRSSISDKLIKIISKNRTNYEEVHNYIKNQIDILKNKLYNSKNEQETMDLKLAIDVWNEFLGNEK